MSLTASLILSFRTYAVELIWHSDAIVMLNEVKHLAAEHCDSLEMFRCAQHDSVPTT